MSGHSSSFGICSFFFFFYGSAISSLPSGIIFLISFLIESVMALRSRHVPFSPFVIFRTIDFWTRSLLNNGGPLCIIERKRSPFVETAKGADVTARPRDFVSGRAANQEPQLWSNGLRDVLGVWIHSLSGFMCGFGELLKVGINLVVLVMSFWTGEEEGGSAPFCERWQRYECRPGAALLFLLLASFFLTSSVLVVFWVWEKSFSWLSVGLGRDWRGIGGQGVGR